MNPVAIDIACRADSACGPPATSSDVAVIPSDDKRLEYDLNVELKMLYLPRRAQSSLCRRGGSG